MPHFKLYFTPALLLLAFMCPMWHVNQSLPVQLTANSPITDACVSNTRVLLLNITKALEQNNLFKTMNLQAVELHMNTTTASVCAPKEPTCSGDTKSEFDQESCLTNIGEDLLYYSNILSAQPDPDQLVTSAVLPNLQELMENCFPWSLSNNSPLKKAIPDHGSTFDERLHLWKVLKGFQIRAITINRAIGYIHSGEHSK